MACTWGDAPWPVAPRPDRALRRPRRVVPPGDRPDALCVGLATIDLVLGVERVPGPDEKVVASSQDIAAGGPAANAAVACAWAGVPARLLTALGTHPLARLAAADLEARGVAVVDANPGRTAPPSMSAILVTEGTGARAVVSRNDRDVPTATLPADASEVLAGAAVVIADGHNAGLAEPVLRAARDAGVPTLVDAGSWRPAFAALLPLADVVVASAAFRPPTATGSRAVLADLLARGAGFAAVTDGPRPIRWASRAGASGSIPVEPVEAVDTLAAGDVLHGVLAALLARPPSSPAASIDPTGLDTGRIVRLIEASARVASASCTYRGTRAWLTAPIARPVSE